MSFSLVDSILITNSTLQDLLVAQVVSLDISDSSTWSKLPTSRPSVHKIVTFSTRWARAMAYVAKIYHLMVVASRSLRPSVLLWMKGLDRGRRISSVAFTMKLTTERSCSKFWTRTTKSFIQPWKARQSEAMTASHAKTMSSYWQGGDQGTIENEAMFLPVLQFQPQHSTQYQLCETAKNDDDGNDNL